MKTGRRGFLQASLVAGVAAIAAPRVRADADAAAGDATRVDNDGVDAASVYAGAIAIDGMGAPDTIDRADGEALPDAVLAELAGSGLAATHFTVGTVGAMPALVAFERVVRSIAKWERRIDQAPRVLARVRSVADIRAARRQQRLGLIYGLQDGVAFEDEPDRLDTLHQLGVRVVQPTYNRSNLLGAGVMEPEDTGLSATGREAVARLQSLGMLLDLSHCGRRTSADAIAMATRPVAFTHTGCAALVDHPRHRTDAELRAVADSGGVTGIFVMPYLSRGRQPRAADVVAHIEHAIKVAGSAHVAIGTDGSVPAVDLTPAYVAEYRELTRKRRADGIAAPYETDDGFLFASDLNHARRFESLAELLLERGHAPEVVSGVLGGNLLRVFGDAWGETGA